MSSSMCKRCRCNHKLNKCPNVLFVSALDVLLRFMDSDCPFGIFKLLLSWYQSRVIRNPSSFIGNWHSLLPVICSDVVVIGHVGYHSVIIIAILFLVYSRFSDHSLILFYRSLMWERSFFQWFRTLKYNGKTDGIMGEWVIVV